MSEGISLDDLKLLREMGEQISDAGGPTLAFQLINQKRALEDRLSFKKWLADTQALSTAEDEAQQAKIAATAGLSRRAQLRLSSF